MSKKNYSVRTNYRDSEDGQWVTKEYADKHPKTTEKDLASVPTDDQGNNKKARIQ